MNFPIIVLSVLLELIPMGDAFIRPKQADRDSVLVGDRLEYGVVFDAVPGEQGLFLPDFSVLGSDTLSVVGGWKLDTLEGNRVEASIEFALFEEGLIGFPPAPVVRRMPDGRIDTLVYGGASVEVLPIQIDTASYVPKDIKGLARYPVTFAEVAVWAGIVLLIAAVIAGIVFLVLYIRRRNSPVPTESLDPPHIVALRKLDRYRGNKYWAPDKQKQFYSGVTDALKEYIDGRFGVDAPEMTTDELFAAIKGTREITADLYLPLKDLFRTADYVKFAKLTVDDDTNAGVLPLAVRFVTETYRTEEEAAVKE